MKKRFMLIFLILLLSVASIHGNMLINFYHANHGPVERLVFVFNEYPRYRIREDPLDINISFLRCGKNPEIKTGPFDVQEVISRITFVETDAFIGVLINSYDGYGMDHFILHTEEGYKLVMDVFRYLDPPTPLMARDYARFYEKVALFNKAEYYRHIADSLEINLTNAVEEQIVRPVEPFRNDKIEIPDTYEPEEPLVPLKMADEEPEKEVIDPSKTEERKENVYKKLNQKLPDIIKDIFEDRMLMFSIIIVAVIILAMIIMSIIRRFHKKRKPVETAPSDSFGTEEFQRVTIKRLLANGWQVEEIAREMNLTVEEVEEFGRGK